MSEEENKSKLNDIIASLSLDQQYLICTAKSFEHIEMLIYNLQERIKFTFERAWSQFTTVSDSFSLDGSIESWLACAIYSACSTIPTTTMNGKEILGNCISLTRLLSEVNVSLIEFMSKIRRWSEMSSLGNRFNEKIQQLERNFSVVTVVFKKFVPIFEDVFGPENGGTGTPAKLRKGKKILLWHQVRTTTWLLFIYAKSNFPGISDDLVNSYSLLICVINFIYLNVLGIRPSRHLLNKDFPGTDDKIDSNFSDLTSRFDGIVDHEENCILEALCERHQGVFIDVKSINIYHFRPFILQLCKYRHLELKDHDNLVGMFENSLLDGHLKTLENLYHEFVLTRGDFDERVFLNNKADERIGTPVKGGANFTPSSKFGTPKTRQHFSPMTPLTNRRFMTSPQHVMSPVSQHTQVVTKVRDLVEGYTVEPTSKLISIFAECEDDPSHFVRNIVNESCDKFIATYRKLENGGKCGLVESKIGMAKKLFWKLLESIILEEKQRISHKGITLNLLLKKEVIIKSIAACSIEIILWSFQSVKQFKTVVDALEIDSYQFYKVIELVLRADLGNGKSLPRDVIKHLSTIEERILEQYAWSSDSMIWDQISKSLIPRCADVISSNHPNNPLSPTRPVQSSLSERFGSPVGNTNVKRKLFDEEGGQTGSQSEVDSIVKVETNDSEEKVEKIRKNSVDLFYRKIYHMMARRIQHLAARIDVPRVSIGNNLIQTIFTIFENCLIHHSGLFKDRHIDQILLCSVYIVCKVLRPSTEIKFIDILAAYRAQPQFNREVYRTVLIKENQYGDLILFYNTIFAPLIGSKARQFSSNTDHNLNTGPLSPLPCMRQIEFSPRRLSSRHSIFISPHKTKETPDSSTIELLFQQTRQKQALCSINEAINGGKVVGAAKRKRGLEFSSEPTDNIGPGLSKRLKAIKNDRFK